jgi:hypothetical protein
MTQGGTRFARFPWAGIGRAFSPFQWSHTGGEVEEFLIWERGGVGPVREWDTRAISRGAPACDEPG